MSHIAVGAEQEGGKGAEKKKNVGDWVKPLHPAYAVCCELR